LILDTTYLLPLKAVQAILAAFRVESLYRREIVEASYDMRKIIPDYLDCVIVATAIVLKEDVATEDSLILRETEAISSQSTSRRHHHSLATYQSVVFWSPSSNGTWGLQPSR
jgi:hypothetical protein